MKRTNRTTSSTPETRKKANEKIKEMHPTIKKIIQPKMNERQMQMQALKKKVPVYKSGMSGGKTVDLMKRKRGIITSID
jgi:Ser-tRNA(Ala) deacylase AlaX